MYWLSILLELKLNVILPSDIFQLLNRTYIHDKKIDISKKILISKEKGHKNPKPNRYK